MLETYVIHVTKLCNLDCKYCYEKDKTSIYTWEEVKKVIDEIVKYNDSFGIEFLGGEPVLSFDLIKKSVEYMDSIPNINVFQYTITTNSTIINDEIIDFLKKNQKVNWAASIDGNRYANQLRVFKKQDARNSQVNSYEKSVEVLKKILNEIGPERTSVHIVTHPYNVHLMYKSIKHFYDMGIRTIGVGTIESTMVIGREYCLEFVAQLDRVSKSIVSGEFSNLYVDVLDRIKPRTDVKNYIYDNNGKLILETYGRAKDDLVKHATDLNIKASGSSFSEMIEDIREFAYYSHQRNKLEKNN